MGAFLASRRPRRRGLATFPGGSSIYGSNGALTPVTGSPFVADLGAVGVAVDPTGKFAYVTNFGFSASDVSAYTINAGTGALTPVTGSPFAAGGYAPVDVVVDPSGRFAYVTSWDDASVSAFTINASTGRADAGRRVAICGRNDGIWGGGHPTGRFVYACNQGTTQCLATAINASSGALTPVAGSPFAAGTTPTYVAVDFTGKFAYVTNSGSNNISAFKINASSGALTSVAGRRLRRQRAVRYRRS